jgi:hypothetical protein
MTQGDGKGFFVAAGYQGQRIVSTNGRDWTDHQVGKEGEIYRTIAFGKGRAVTLGSFGGGNIYTSTADGKTWEPRGFKDGKFTRFVRGACFGDGQFLAVGADPAFALASADGLQWGEYQTLAVEKQFQVLRRVAYGNGRYAAIGDLGRRSVSKDGVQWTDVPKPDAAQTVIDLAFGAGVFVGVGLDGLCMTSEDGLVWTRRYSGEEGEHLNSVLWTGERFVAVGQGATYFSPDGKAWERRPNRNAPLAAAYGAGGFVGTHWKGRIFYSEDALVWTPVFKSEYHFEVVAYGG